MELALFDGLFFVRVGQIPQLKPAKGLLLSPSANAASRPGLQIDRVYLADERYAKKIAVRYTTALLKPCLLVESLCRAGATEARITY